MSRHIADHSTAPETGARMKSFLRLDRAEGLHPTIRALFRARPAAPAEGRLTSLLKVLRGRPT